MADDNTIAYLGAKTSNMWVGTSETVSKLGTIFGVGVGIGFGKGDVPHVYLFFLYL